MDQPDKTPLEFLIQCVRERVEREYEVKLAEARAAERKRIHEAIMEEDAHYKRQHNYYACLAVRLFPEFSK